MKRQDETDASRDERRTARYRRISQYELIAHLRVRLFKLLWRQHIQDAHRTGRSIEEVFARCIVESGLMPVRKPEKIEAYLDMLDAKSGEPA